MVRGGEEFLVEGNSRLDDGVLAGDAKFVPFFVLDEDFKEGG